MLRIEFSHVHTKNSDTTVFKIKSDDICLSVGVSSPFTFNVFIVVDEFTSMVLLFVIYVSSLFFGRLFLCASCWVNPVFKTIPFCLLCFLATPLYIFGCSLGVTMCILKLS